METRENKIFRRHQFETSSPRQPFRWNTGAVAFFMFRSPYSYINIASLPHSVIFLGFGSEPVRPVNLLYPS